jgi:hypothetical protein
MKFKNTINIEKYLSLSKESDRLNNLNSSQRINKNYSKIQFPNKTHLPTPLAITRENSQKSIKHSLLNKRQFLQKKKENFIISASGLTQSSNFTRFKNAIEIKKPKKGSFKQMNKSNASVRNHSIRLNDGKLSSLQLIS